jgi:hypothetical protein
MNTPRSVRLHRPGKGCDWSEIFTKKVWAAVAEAAGAYDRDRPDWKVKALMETALYMALSSARTRHAQFAEAQDWRRGRWGGGDTFAGFNAAWAALKPAVPAAVRGAWQAEDWARRAAQVGRWAAFSFDGTIVDLALCTELLKHYGAATKEPARPQMLMVAAVALGARWLWDWETGSALAGERALADRLVPRLPPGALTVWDAGFVGHEFVTRILAEGRHVLMRVGANCRLWAEGVGQVVKQGGRVWLWPEAAQADGTPLRLRLIPIRRRKRKWVRYKGKHRRRGKRGRMVTQVETLWLLTDVLDEAALTAAEAEALYRRRWGGSEIGFRDWKQTLLGKKLRSRVPELAAREADFLLLAQQGLQALGLRAQGAGKRELRPVSLAQLLEIWRQTKRRQAARREVRGLRRKLRAAVPDEYVRKKPKQKRRWAQRKEYRVIGGPKIRKLSARLKRKGVERLEAAGG